MKIDFENGLSRGENPQFMKNDANLGIFLPFPASRLQIILLFNSS